MIDLQNYLRIIIRFKTATNCRIYEILERNQQRKTVDEFKCISPLGRVCDSVPVF